MKNRMKKTSFPHLLIYLALVITGLSLWRCTPPKETINLADEPVAALWQIEQETAEDWTVGDRIPLTLYIVYDEAISIPKSSIEAEGELFEIINQASSKPQRGKENLCTTTSIEVVYWSPGDHASPSATITYTDLDGQSQTILVDEIIIQIKSVRAEEDTQKKDLKPQASLPRPPIWGVAQATVITVGLLYGLTLWLLQRLSRPPVSDMQDEPSIDPRPPDEIALTELDRIESLDLPLLGKYKQHYTLISECIRRYFETLFDIPALDRTTEEFLHEIQEAHMGRPIIYAVSNLLNDADLVKFAKAVPTRDTARQMVQQARALVEGTRPMRSTEKEQASK